MELGGSSIRCTTSACARTSPASIGILLLFIVYFDFFYYGFGRAATCFSTPYDDHETYASSDEQVDEWMDGWMKGYPPKKTETRQKKIGTLPWFVFTK